MMHLLPAECPGIAWLRVPKSGSFHETLVGVDETFHRPTAFLYRRDMVNPDFYRQIAGHCRTLLRATRNPELIAQLETWAVECDRRADRALRKKPNDDIREQAKRYQMRA